MGLRGWRPLHPEHSETRLLHGRVERRAEAQAQNHAGVGRIDDPIIPQSAERKTAERITPPADSLTSFHLSRLSLGLKKKKSFPPS